MLGRIDKDEPHGLMKSTVSSLVGSMWRGWVSKCSGDARDSAGSRLIRAERDALGRADTDCLYSQEEETEMVSVDSHHGVNLINTGKLSSCT